ncbi:hypothetical protein KCMC57_up06880 [Kitasatospora sp. CMC57]|uniref:PAS fold-4 domain-containing protein n=1 Tax=Kitasatospora sp. CMC57 TaxID=3231513 RepID=A0AB33JNA3_9ACTN
MPEEVFVPVDGDVLSGDLAVPSDRGVVVFAHGSGSSRHSPRNRAVAAVLRQAGLGTLLLDLLTGREEQRDLVTAEHRFDIGLLSARLIAAVDWLAARPETGGLPVGLFGASTGAAAALRAAAERPVEAVVSRGGRPDLAGADALRRVRAPVLLIVGGHDPEVLPFVDARATEAAMREVLANGLPRLDQFITGRTPADPEEEHAWSVSFYRLEDPAGRMIGLATTAVDITEQHRAATAAARARRRLAMIADASVRIGTTLDLDVTARELAGAVVPELADVAAVDVLDRALTATQPAEDDGVAGMSFRALAVKTAYDSPAAVAADPVGETAR